jgi:hypothetical protein
MGSETVEWIEADEMDELLSMPDVELEFRGALSELLTGRKADGEITDLEREIAITPYDGAYGRAGVVITIEGSPPRALLLVTTDRGTSGAYVLVLRRPYRSGPAIEIEAPIWQVQNVTNRKQRLYRATIAYLKSQGVLR